MKVIIVKWKYCLLIAKETTVINFTAIVAVVDGIDIINSLCTLSGEGTALNQQRNSCL